MGLNVGAIYVQAKAGLSPGQVADEVSRYWKSKGARREDKLPKGLKPLGVTEKKSKQLGVAVAPESGGWIGVRDSERYFADHRLAKKLSSALKSRVCWLVISETTDSAILQFLEKGQAEETVEGLEHVGDAVKTARFPGLNLHFEDLQKKRPSGTILFSVAPVTATNYDTGPEPKESDEDGGPPPDPKFAAWHERLDKGFLLGERDWENVFDLDKSFLPEICRLGHRALLGKEARPDVLVALAGRAAQAQDQALFKAVLDRSPFAKLHPIDTPSLMWRLGAWMSGTLFKKRFPPDWKSSVETWIKAALKHTARQEDIPACVAMAFARLGNGKKCEEYARLALENRTFHPSGLSRDPVAVPYLRKEPFAAEVASVR